jgi:hypothetical protein
MHRCSPTLNSAVNLQSANSVAISAVQESRVLSHDNEQTVKRRHDSLTIKNVTHTILATVPVLRVQIQIVDCYCTGLLLS